MNEVRQVWTSLAIRSPRASTSPASNNNNNHQNNSNTRWYDVPVPVIIHNREFSDEKAGANERTETAGREETGEEVGVTLNEVLYQNNVEAALNSLSKICVEPAKAEVQPNAGAIGRDEYRRRSIGASSVEVEEVERRRRHSSSVELTATSSLKIGNDGMPTISFSFLRAEETAKVNEAAKIKVEEPDERRRTAVVGRDQLYDFPKSSVEEEPKVEEGDGGCKKTRQLTKSLGGDNDEKLAIRDELYDVPKTSKGRSAEKKRPGDSVETSNSSQSKNDEAKASRASRSLGSGRSVRIVDYDRPEAVGPSSGSYSDPECPEGRSSESLGTLERNKRLRRQKRRLGKAWGKMRSWLREERSKLGEVVTKHARMQAVGALQGGAAASEDLAVAQGQSGSYDLAKAREVSPVVKDEELSAVSEEGNASGPEEPRSGTFCPHSDKEAALLEESAETKWPGRMKQRKKRRTASTENVVDGLGTNARSTSISLDGLSSDEENEETESKDPVGKGGLIKRRMLGSIRGLMASTHLLQTHEVDERGQGGFEEIRRYVKQGGDFCKDLAAILHERAELEATYSKSLSKLSNKLTKACSKDQGSNGAGSITESWRCVGEEMEAAAEAHRAWGIALSEQLAKPLRVGVAEAQGRSRKVVENSVDKALKSLQEWRGIAAKSKKQSFSCARDNERLQDLARLQSISQGQQNNGKPSNHHMTEKEANKLETRRRKAENSSRRADTEFYTVSVRSERARLEYESTVRKGAKQMELLEEERLSALKDLGNVYLAHLQALAPRLQQSADRLSTPIRNCDVTQDVEILTNLIRRIDRNDSSNAEQLLPDFYAEHVTLAMNRERRKQALVRILHLIRQDLERERRGREGLETLHRAFIKTPAFAADESTQNVTDKLHHMRSMLMYLEAARYKVGGTLAETEGGKRGKHPLAEHILVSRDKQGLQQSVLKIPSWAKNECFDLQEGQDELDDIHFSKDHETDNRDWLDRTAGDGNSENPPDEEDFSDFDAFSSHSEDNNNQENDNADITKNVRTEKCRAMYQYSANLNDELSLSPGDLITIHEKQDDGWWIGECRGLTGIFPATYVQLIH